MRHCLKICSLLALALLAAAAEAAEPAPAFNRAVGAKQVARLTLRARVLAMQPEQPVAIRWGFGEATEVNAGSLCHQRITPPEVDQPGSGEDLLGELLDAEGAGGKDRLIVEQGGYQVHYLKRNAWSPPISLADMLPAERYQQRMTGLYTFALMPLEGDVQAIRNVVMEFEILQDGQPLKRIQQDGKHGPTLAISLRGLRALYYGSQATDRAFLDNCVSLVDYVQQQRAWIDEQPWGTLPVPKRYPFATICSGHDEGFGYDVKHTSPKVTTAEYEIVRALGINGLRGQAHLEEWRNVFGRAPLVLMGKSSGYPLPQPDLFTDDPLTRFPPGTGCPFYPDNVVRARTNAQAAVEQMLSHVGVEEFWGITEDEIGSAFNGPDRFAHVYSCPHCIAGFRAWLKRQGLTPDDFGRANWNEIDPWDARQGPRPQAWRERTTLALAKGAENQGQVDKEILGRLENPRPDSASDVLQDLKKKAQASAPAERSNAPGAQPDEEEDPDAQADRRLVEALSGKTADTPAAGSTTDASTDFGRQMIDYYLARFESEGSAQLFDPLREACDRANAAKRAALAAGRVDSPAARQPYVYSYALRQQHVYHGGIYNFYRHADNGFMYETSSSDRRHHIFDSLYCDVGRVLGQRLNKRPGILIKPVRGATTQRAMTFLSREGRLIYWYNYGPKYGGKITSVFSHKGFLKERVGRFSRIVAQAEETVEGSRWAYPAEVAICWPLTSSIHARGEGLADSMGIWLALTHANIPVDPLDEGFLLSENLSQYKVIYVSGPGIRRDVAERLARWVAAGGVLYSGGASLRYDEARRPLESWLPILGMAGRGLREERFIGRQIVGQGALAGSFKLKSPAELLKPAASAEVLAKFSDGVPALVRNRYGQGWVYTAAFMAGKEYQMPLNRRGSDGVLNMEESVDRIRGLYLTAPARQHGVAPVVETGKAYIEGQLLEHPENHRLAVTLVNWACESRSADAPLEEIVWKDLEIRVRVPRAITGARSAVSLQALSVRMDGNWAVVSIPELKDVDLLLLQ